MNMHLLFVYGTLRKGGENEITRLYPAAVCVGNANITGRLFDMGGYPAIVLDEKAHAVVGEVYSIDNQTLARLDEFESDAGYDRISIDVMVNDLFRAWWLYRPPRALTAGRPEIASGDWISLRRKKAY